MEVVKKHVPHSVEGAYAAPVNFLLLWTVMLPIVFTVQLE